MYGPILGLLPIFFFFFFLREATFLSAPAPYTMYLR
jgi:hypothetical protein